MLLPSEPQVFISATGKCKHLKKDKFTALSRREAAYINLGSIRPQRCTELWKAAAGGNVARLLAVIETGVNLDATDEFGHSALFLAAWHGHYRATQLLLRAGAAIIPDNAGTTPFQAACASGHGNAKMQSIFAGEASTESCRNDALLPSSALCASLCENLRRNSLGVPVTVTTLIPDGSDHPGAGSFVIDSCFSDRFLETLENLFYRLPIAPAEKSACSDRAYYCDVNKFVSSALEMLLRTNILSLDNESNNSRSRCGGKGDSQSPSTAAVEVQVLPQMRFLHYTTPGGYLPPHIDLSRLSSGTEIHSTHTFIIYLTDCAQGGETRLLEVSALSRANVKVKGMGEGKSIGRASDDDGASVCLDSSETHVEEEVEPEHRQQGERQQEPSFHGSFNGHTQPSTTISNISTGAVDLKADSDDVIAAVAPKRGRVLIFPHACPHDGATVVEVPKLLLRGEIVLPALKQ
jgi:hypothetical protein